ncbi:MAG: hypothetical protein ACM3UZ_10895 [Acidobacteriota bacterium]
MVSLDTRMSIILKKFPYPYNAMLAIANDVDNEDISHFRELHRFLNTHEKTSMGDGLGLDVGDSFWMYGPEDETLLTYWKGYDWSRENNAREILKYIRCGWIDSIHSYGDYNNEQRFSREHAVKSLEELTKQNLRLKVWINHGNFNNIQNFPGAFMAHDDHRHMQGDLPSSRAYHTDLTIPYGIQFVQDYTMYDEMGHESLLRPLSLWDGQQIWGFRRLEARKETFWRKGYRVLMGRLGIKVAFWLWYPEHLGEQLSQQNLDSIAAKQQYSIIGQHMGIWRKSWPKSAIEGLQRLKAMSQNRQILVARLSRLLEYNRTHNYLKYQVDQVNDRTKIDIMSVEDPVCGAMIPSLEQIRGITFANVMAPDKTTICLNGLEIDEKEIVRSLGDKCIGVRWFEPDFTDYSR